MDRLVDHVVVLDRAQEQAFRAHQLKDTRAPTPEELRHVESLQAYLDAMPPGHPSVPALMEAVRAGRQRAESFLAPLQTTGAALHHLGEQRFVEVPHSCSCGRSLASAPGDLAGEWATHAAAITGLDEDLLLAHAVLGIHDADRASVRCRCGAVLVAPDRDPTDPGAALEAHEQHVRDQA